MASPPQHILKHSPKTKQPGLPDLLALTLAQEEGGINFWQLTLHELGRQVLVDGVVAPGLREQWGDVAIGAHVLVGEDGLGTRRW